MAEKKNFTIENYNGTDYDTLYPQTNSGQVLLDTDAQSSTGLSSGSTVDDALEILGNVNNFDNRYEVGDVFTTARDNLSDKWALCNGAQATGSEYPELSNIFQSKFCNFQKIRQTTFTKPGYSSGMVARERSGIKEAIYSSYSGTSTTMYYINLSSGATSTNLPTKITGQLDCVNNIFFWGAYWCDGDPTDSSSWNYLSHLHTKILYRNGKYYIFYYNTLYIYTSLSSPDKTINLSNLTGHQVMDVGVDGDNLLITARTGDSYSNYKYYIDIISPDGQLVSSTQTTIAFTGENYGLLTKFPNGYLVVQNNFENIIYKYSQTLNGSLTTIATVPAYGEHYVGDFLDYNRAVIDDSYIVLPNNTYIDSNFNLNSIASSTGTTIANLATDNNNIYALCYDSFATVYSSLKTATFNLPSYSPATGLYAYIKAKN